MTVRTFFGDLAGILSDVIDEVAVDVNAMDSAVKSRGARLSQKQQAGLMQIREEVGDLDALVARLLGPSPAIKSVGALPASDLVTAPGSAIKAVGSSGLVQGYLVRYGGAGDLSPHRDIFTKDTYFGRARQVDAFVHHGQLPPPYGDRVLANAAELERDDLGIFCKLILDMSDQYEAALHRLAQQGKLGWSSGALSHTVKRDAQKNGTHLVRRWIIGEASLTPQPAGGPTMRAHAAMKSLLLDVGLDVTKPLPVRRQETPAVLLPGPSSGMVIDTSDRWGIRK